MGRHRGASADVVVIPDIAALHDVEMLAADVDRAVCFLYIVLRGLPVTTSSRLSAASGRVKDIPMQHRMFHVALLQRKFRFHVGPQLQEVHRDVYRALRRLARMPGCGFRIDGEIPAPGGDGEIPAPGGSAPAPGGSDAVTIRTLVDVVAWACSARRTENLVGPKVVGMGGVPLAT